MVSIHQEGGRGDALRAAEERSEDGKAKPKWFKMK